jgi:outer membrane lipoprotein-sorting protein
MLRFLRTAPTRRLLVTIGLAVAAAIAGTAIAVAARSSGPVPKRAPLANAIHRALAAPRVKGISASISFTNNLIDSSDFAGGEAVDPILQGASGRLWMSDDGRLRLELQSDNGDAQVVVNHDRFWISDPISHTVYEGTLPRDRSGAHQGSQGIPSLARIQSFLTRLMGKVNVSGAQPTDVAGQAAYRVVVSPKHDGGLLGSVQLAWDAERGVPLQFAIYARGNSTPVLSLRATNISYGSVPASDFDVTPPAGSQIVRLGSTGHAHGSGADRRGSGSDSLGSLALRRVRHRLLHGHADRARHRVTSVHAVAAAVPFTLDAPRTLVGLPRHAVRLLRMGSEPAAMVAYGENLGGIVVIEHKATGGATGDASIGGLSLPTVSINGAKGQELSTPLGTVLTFTRGGVSYTVLGSVPATAAELAARAL